MTSFARPPVSSLIKTGDIAKEFQQKTIQLHWTFRELKITNELTLRCLIEVGVGINGGGWGGWKNSKNVIDGGLE